MPEGDTLWRAARTLQRAIGGRVVTRFESVLPKLNRIDEDTPLTGRTVEQVESEGKWLVMRFSGDLILLTHMLMSGSWHIYRPGEKWKRPRSQMRIVIETAEMLAVAFEVPVAEFHTRESLEKRAGFRTLGPRVLEDDFDAGQAITNLRAEPEMEIGVALLAQRLLSGIGNVFKSESLFIAGINPFRRVKEIADAELRAIVQAAVKLMRANIAEGMGDPIVTYFGLRRTTGRSDPAENYWVYYRTGRPCRKCGTPIQGVKHQADARRSFWCPHCQPATPKLPAIIEAS